MKKTLADMQAAVAREATMPRQKGPNPFTGTPTSTSNGMGSPIGRAPMGMATRPPVIANKARGTMASHTYSKIPASMSGMGQPPLSSTSQNMGQQIARAPRGGMGQPEGQFKPSGRMAM
jgi:hypothetical protein